MSMQKIVADDLVRDEYGNFYKVVGTHMEEDTLKGIEVSNLYFETSFQGISDKMSEEYKGKPLGVYVQDQTNAYIEEIEKKDRPIYGIRDLMVNKIEVFAVDITKPHPQRDQTL